MKIYLAGGMTVMNIKGRERQLAEKFPVWNRLFSYHYKILIYKSEILQIKKEDNEYQQNRIIKSIRTRKAGSV